MRELRTCGALKGMSLTSCVKTPAPWCTSQLLVNKSDATGQLQHFCCAHGSIGCNSDMPPTLCKHCDAALQATWQRVDEPAAGIGRGAPADAAVPAARDHAAGCQAGPHHRSQHVRSADRRPKVPAGHKTLPPGFPSVQSCSSMPWQRQIDRCLALWIVYLHRQQLLDMHKSMPYGCVLSNGVSFSIFFDHARCRCLLLNLLPTPGSQSVGAAHPPGAGDGQGCVVQRRLALRLAAAAGYGPQCGSHAAPAARHGANAAAAAAAGATVAAPATGMVCSMPSSMADKHRVTAAACLLRWRCL